MELIKHFKTFSPFNPKTISRNINKIINPDDSIEGILNNLGGMLFKFQNPNEEISIDIFSWLSPYLKQIVESNDFIIMTTIELDATFDTLENYVINTSIPLGLFVSISVKWLQIFLRDSKNKNDISP